MKLRAIILSALVAVSLAAVEIPLKNTNFKMKDGKLIDWGIENKCNFEVVPCGYEDGINAIMLYSFQGDKYRGIYQGGFDMSKFPRTADDEMLKVTLTFRQKNVNVADGGFANAAFYSDKGLLASRDFRKRPGSFDWTDVETSVTFKEFPKDARYFHIYLYLGKTTGAVFFAEPKLYVDVVKKTK